MIFSYKVRYKLYRAIWAFALVFGIIALVDNIVHGRYHQSPLTVAGTACLAVALLILLPSGRARP